jgi:hypothetical protein
MLLALPSADTRKMFCATAWAPAENDGSWEIMFVALRKAFASANVTPALRTLDRCAVGTMLVRSIAPLVREANARAKDLVILHESEVGTSLDVIHSIFAGLNSDSDLKHDSLFSRKSEFPTVLFSVKLRNYGFAVIS